MKPNFLIVGAPKCGTTAMWRYLNQHPDVFLSPRKDIHYFGSDLAFRRRSRFTRQEYEAFFSDCTEQSCGEASVWYLHSKKAAQEIYNYNPKMKIIIMLRDPIQLMYAHYTQMRLNALGDEDLPTFSQALEAEPARKRGEQIPKNNSIVSALFYTDIGTLSVQIQRYLDIFPREQVLFLFQEDMKTKMPTLYKDTLSFLGVHTDFSPDFARINSHKEIRYEFVRKLIGKTPTPFKRILPASKQQQLSRWLRKINTKHAKRPKLDPTLEHRLRSQFLNEIEALSVIVERDLNHWKAQEL